MSAVAAVAAKTWVERIREAMRAQVDTEAITAALAEGADPQAAVDAGVDLEPGALALVLADLYAEQYDRGAKEAAAKLPAEKAAASRVTAGLMDLLSKAREIASGILSTLRDRLGGGIEAAGEGETGALADMLDGIAGDGTRAGIIAVTETRRAMIEGAVDVYSGAGVRALLWVRTSGSDLPDECGERNGVVDEWMNDPPPLHPNCACVIEPADSGSAAQAAPPPDRWQEVAEQLRALAARDVVVNVAAPPPRALAREVERDDEGNITRIIERPDQED